MNMLTPHRRNPSRRRQAPKRFEDEKFVSGRVDQYTRGYEGRDSNWRAAEEDAENYYNTKNGRKFCYAVWNSRGKYRIQLRDFPETLLELTSIWRDFGLVLPSALLQEIGSYLRISKVDRALLEDDDTFVVGDNDSESEYESEKDTKKWRCSGLPMDDEEWSSCEDTDESDYDSDDLYEDD
jgi:hypothetical protein